MAYQRFNLRNKVHRDAERAIDFLYEYVDKVAAKVASTSEASQQGIQAVRIESQNLVDSFATKVIGESSVDPLLETLGTGNGTVVSVATGTGLTGGPIITTGTVALANTAVTPGSYTKTNLTVDAQGRLTAASSGGANYKVYTALFTCGASPSAAVLENTLSGTVVWTQMAAGDYQGALASAFTSNKTWFSALLPDNGDAGNSEATVFLKRLDSNTVQLRIYDKSQVLADSTTLSVEIRVYT